MSVIRSFVAGLICLLSIGVSAQTAEELVAKLTADKKSTHFIQMVKEPLEEKKEV